MDVPERCAGKAAVSEIAPVQAAERQGQNASARKFAPGSRFFARRPATGRSSPTGLEERGPVRQLGRSVPIRAVAAGVRRGRPGSGGSTWPPSISRPTFPGTTSDTGVTKAFLRAGIRTGHEGRNHAVLPGRILRRMPRLRFYRGHGKKFRPPARGRGGASASPKNRRRRKGEETSCDTSASTPRKDRSGSSAITTWSTPIQRTFRRAGVQVAYSEGFHPKMRMSFLPASGPGHGGSGRTARIQDAGPVSDPAAFLEALNACSPEGLRFLRLELLDEGNASACAPPRGWSTASTWTVRPSGRRSERAAETPDVSDRRDRPTAESRGADSIRSDRPEMESDASGKRLVILRYAFNPQKAPRPQDAVTALLGLSDPAHVIVRDAG